MKWPTIGPAAAVRVLVVIALLVGALMGVDTVRVGECLGDVLALSGLSFK